MATLFDLIPDTEAVLALEPEELAGVALELVIPMADENRQQIHPTNFINPAMIGPFEQRLHDIERAMAEAWNWLIREGLLAPAPGDSHSWHFVTRRGMRLKDRQGVASYSSLVLLPRALLHPSILQCCWSAFMRGEYDTAVFQAFRELEVSIRGAGGYSADDIGVPLAQKAFGVSGPLTDLSAPPGERVALLNMMTGALGSYKNPHSHRRVHLSAEDASEMIVMASHLMKIIDTRPLPAALSACRHAITTPI